MSDFPSCLPADVLQLVSAPCGRPTVGNAVAKWLSGSCDRNRGCADRLVKHCQLPRDIEAANEPVPNGPPSDQRELVKK